MHINIINPNASQKAFQDENRFGWLSSEDFEIWFYRTVLAGIPINLDSNYPDCCSFHKDFYTNTFAYFEKFPNCCPQHQKLLIAPWFNKKEAIKGFAEKTIETALQTEALIASKIDELDWYDHITEFIEYGIESFGQPPTGYGPPIAVHVYFSHLKSYFNVFPQIPPEKSGKLLAFIKSYESYHGKASLIDLNELSDIYKRWMDTFPWEISFFKGQKAQFENRMPFLAEKPRFNRYSRISKAKVISQEALIKWLVDTTTIILKTLNSRTLKEEMDASTFELKQIELINAQRDQQLSQLGQNIKDERKRYFRILRQWFNGEKRYIKEMVEVLSGMEARKAAVKSDRNTEKSGFSLNDIENKFCIKMPISVAIDHFSKLVDFNSSNGKPFLQQSQLEDFIAAAFGRLPDRPKHRINISRGEKGIIIGLFYAFFRKATSELYEPTLQCKYKYIKLLSDYFEGWEEKSIQRNFRESKLKGPW